MAAIAQILAYFFLIFDLKKPNLILQVVMFDIKIFTT